AEDIPVWAPMQALARWDSGWYGEIAQNGYWLNPGQQSPVVFFPGYPMSVRLLTWVGMNRWVAGEVLSLACALAAIFLLKRWGSLAIATPRQQIDQATRDGVVHQACWLLALYPFATYLYGVVYSEAFFLVAAISAFLALERRQHIWAAVFGAIATASRPIAPALVVGLLVRSLELRRQSGNPLRIIDFVPALAGIGLAGYMLFLQVQFDDALAFAHLQAAPGWDQPPGWQSWLKVAWFKELFPHSSLEVKLRFFTHAIATFVALGLTIPTFKRLGYGYGFYCLIAVGIPAISSKDFHSLGRYIMAAFPLFLTAAMLLESRPKFARWVTAVFAVGLGCLAFALGANYYVA
ncbi:MAG: hypothetical protein AAB401_08250, partial [Acidobacteriota bacterium]